MVTLKYAEISSFHFSQAWQKVVTTPTHGAKASRIHKIAKALQDRRNEISKEYQEKIAMVFGKKDEKGELIRPAGEPNGYEPLDDQMEALEAAQTEFGKLITTFDSMQPVDLELMADVKLSGQDLEALAGLYQGNVVTAETPVDNVQAIR